MPLPGPVTYKETRVKDEMGRYGRGGKELVFWAAGTNSYKHSSWGLQKFQVKMRSGHARTARSVPPPACRILGNTPTPQFTPPSQPFVFLCLKHSLVVSVLTPGLFFLFWDRVAQTGLGRILQSRQLLNLQFCSLSLRLSWAYRSVPPYPVLYKNTMVRLRAYCQSRVISSWDPQFHPQRPYLGTTVFAGSGH